MAMTAGPRFTLLDHRAVLAVTGEDRVGFLQGLVSNDVDEAAAGRAVHAGFLTPQGKYLHDFIIVEGGGRLLLDVEAGRMADLSRRLALYRLRAKVTIAPEPGLRVAAAFGGDAPARLGLGPEPGWVRPFAGGHAFVDPRPADLGVRLMLPAAGAEAALLEAGLAPAAADDYDRLRLLAGVADGARDIDVERSTLIEANFDRLAGISWSKGCYLGQELTARTHYRGLVKRRLVPVEVEGEAPPSGTPVTAGGREVGELRSGCGRHALALLRLDALAGGEPLAAAGARVTPRLPGWFQA
jgi:folate-binding protein YgfZ